jgi:beta-lactamase regulating signal transducer with metallopeptidase domain
MEWLDAFLANPIIDALGWTLIHFLWQGVLIGSAVYIVLSLLRNSKASTRYIVLCLGMMALLAAPIKTFVDIYGATGSEIAQIDDPAVVRYNATHPDNVIRLDPGRSDVQFLPDPDAKAGSLQTQSQPNGWISSASMRWFGQGKITTVAIQVENWMIGHLEWLVLAWVVGMFLMAVRLIGGFAYVQWIRHYKATPAAEHLQETMLKLKNRLGINETVELLNSVRVKVPMVIGWMKPAILIPTSMLTGLSTEQIESIVAHELAHIRRYDYLINIFQLIVETLLFYHPVVWWMSNEMRIEREHSCDDLAVAVTGDAMTYARALTNLEELRMGHQSGVFAMAATDGSLMSRIRRIMGVSAGDANQSSNWLVGLLILAGMVGMGATYASDQLDSIKDRMAKAEVAPAPKVSKADMSTWSTSSNPNPNPNNNYNYNYNYSVDSEGNMKVDVDLSQLKGLEKLEALAALEAGKGQNQSQIEYWSKFGQKWGEAWGKAFAEVNGEEIGKSVSKALENLDFSMTPKNYYDEDGKYTVEEIIEMKKFGVTREYIDAIKAAGYENLSADGMIDFKKFGVSVSLIEALSEAGYANLDPEELIELAKFGVSVSYIEEVRKAGFEDLSAEQIADMKKYGADLDMIASLRSEGFTDIDAEDVIDMAKYGVDGNYIREIRAAGYDNLSTNELADMKKFGVTPALIQSLRDFGYNNLDPDELSDLAKYGVTAEYIKAINASGFDQLRIEDYADMKKYGVDPATVNALMQAGGSNLTVDEVVDMAKYGVSTDYIQAIREAGVPISDMDEIVDMRKFGVDTGYIQNMRAVLGSDRNVTPAMWSDMHKFGVTPSLVTAVKDYGLTDWDTEDLSNMAKFGVDAEFLQELKDNDLADLPVDKIVDLKKYGVDIEYIKSMQQR